VQLRLVGPEKADLVRIADYCLCSNIQEFFCRTVSCTMRSVKREILGNKMLPVGSLAVVYRVFFQMVFISNVDIYVTCWEKMIMLSNSLSDGPQQGLVFGERER
jgi:hypothetical protein